MTAINRGSIVKEFKGDVAVVGGGVAGLAAAVAAARTGSNVYLIESNGVLGGSATAGLIGRFQIGPDVKGSPVIMGLFDEICERLKGYETAQKGRTDRDLLFDPEMMKFVAFDFCEEAGVHVLLHATAYDVSVKKGHVERIAFYTKQGPAEVKAYSYVDATGDGTVSALAGAEWKMGRDSDGLTQPMTLIFQLGNVDHGQMKSADWAQLSAKFREEIKGVAYRDRIFYFEWSEGLLGFCISHVARKNPLDVEQLTEAEITARRQALQVLKFFRRNVPGCERCVMASAASDIGIRESRRIMGDYVLTREDVLGCRKFDDSIGCSTSWIDLHNPEGKGVLHELVAPDDWFEIPLRSLLVKGFANLLVAGRCMSVTHEAQGGIREMPTCIEAGQGAGVAAALAAKQKKQVRELDIKEIQKTLVSQGVKLR